jgi:hypothetical protein
MKLYSQALLASLLASFALTAGGCAKDPSKDVPAAKVEEPKAEPKAVEPPAAASPVAAPA